MKHPTLPINGESPARNGIADIPASSMARAIVAKYCGPTATKGSRIKAWIGGDGKSLATVFVPWDHSLDNEENFADAARACLKKAREVSEGRFFSEPVHLVGGYLGNGVHVFSIRRRD